MYKSRRASLDDYQHPGNAITPRSKLHLNLGTLVWRCRGNIDGPSDANNHPSEKRMNSRTRRSKETEICKNN